LADYVIDKCPVLVESEKQGKGSIAESVTGWERNGVIYLLKNGC
jgi:hypothetical protein